MMRRAGLIVLASCVLAADARLYAEDDYMSLSLEALLNIPVFAASRNIQTVSEAPAFVTVITGEEINQFGDQTLTEVLDRVAGFYSTEDRTYSYVGSRGIGLPGNYNARYLVMVNGVRVNESVYDSFGSGRDFILDMKIVDRIEIVRGASSSLYGTSAFFGVVNVITKARQDMDGVEVAAEYGAHGARQGSFAFGRGFANGLEMVAQGSLFRNDGRSFFFEEFNDPATNNGVTDPAGDAERDANLFLRMLAGNYEIQAGLSSRTKHDPTAAWGTIFGDTGFAVRDKMVFVDACLRREFFGDWFGVGRVGLNHYEYRGDYPYDYAAAGDPVERALNRDMSESLTWLGEFSLATEKYRNQMLIVGAESRWNARQSQMNYDLDWPEEPYFDNNQESFISGVYAQDEIRLSKHLVMTAGLRYDHYETFGGALSPRLSLVMTPARNSTVKLLYGEAFRAPNVYELYYEDGEGSQKANPDLYPEDLQSYEVVFEQKLDRHWQMTASVYQYEAHRLIGQRTDPGDSLLQYWNMGQATAKGLDLVLVGRSESGLSGRLSYSFARARARENNDDVQLPNSPSDLVKLTLMTPIMGQNLHAGFSARYISTRRDVQRQEIGANLVTDLTLRARIPAVGMEIRAGLYNLLNEPGDLPIGDEHEQSSIPADGRNARVSAKYRF